MNNPRVTEKSGESDLFVCSRPKTRGVEFRCFELPRPSSELAERGFIAIIFHLILQRSSKVICSSVVNTTLRRIINYKFIESQIIPGTIRKINTTRAAETVGLILDVFFFFIVRTGFKRCSFASNKNLRDYTFLISKINK